MNRELGKRRTRPVERNARWLLRTVKKASLDQYASSSAAVTRSSDDQQLFRGNMCVCPFFVFSRACST